MAQLVSELIKRIPFFQQLSHEVLDEMAAIGKIEAWPAGAQIFLEGDPAESLYLVLSGRVGIQKTLPNTEKVEVAEIGAGDFFGEMAIIESSPRSASAQTLAPCELFTITRDKFTELLSQCPRFIPEVMASLVGKLRVVNERFLLEVHEKQKLQVKLIQERYRSISQIAASANEASSVEDAMKIVIELICKYIGWPVGHVSVIDEKVKGRLFSSGIWHLEDSDRFAQFRMMTEMSHFSEGEGIPGRVLRKSKAEWAEDLTRVCPRQAAVHLCGLQSGFGFPVIVGKDVAAVLEFYSDQQLSIDRTLLEATDQIGMQLGRIIERNRLTEQLVHNAFHDSLTGLPNRALFMDHLGMSLARARRDSDYLYAVLFIDLDRFKWINDSLGHLAGDQLLGEVAKRLRGCIRSSDTIARLGGDEFGILLDGLEQVSEVTRAVERIRTRMQAPTPLKGDDVFTSASIGVALSTTGYSDSEAPLRDADTAMYRAKSMGPGNYAVFDPSMHESAVRRLRLDNELRQGIERGELRLHYQPIVLTDTSAVVGFESLVRWQHPTLGLLGPMDFLPIAEDTDLIIPITEWVMEEACRQVREWINAFPTGVKFAVSTNLAPKYFIRRELDERIKALLNRHKFDAMNLILEITEGQVMEDPPAVARMLNRLAEMGLRVHIDDFGTGYSSLAYLTKLRVDGLKIDRAFVSQIGKDPGNEAIIRSIISLGRNLGLHVIAEGVETKEQQEFLQEDKCRFSQGYLFARPMKAEDATEYLRRSYFPEFDEAELITRVDLGDFLLQK